MPLSLGTEGDFKYRSSFSRIQQSYSVFGTAQVELSGQGGFSSDFSSFSSAKQGKSDL